MLILTSPYVRTRETSEILRDHLKKQPKAHRASSALACGARNSPISSSGRTTARKKRSPGVGHMPDVALMTAALIGDKHTLDRLRQRVAVAAIDFDERDRRQATGVLRWFRQPETLGLLKHGDVSRTVSADFRSQRRVLSSRTLPPRISPVGCSPWPVDLELANILTFCLSTSAICPFRPDGFRSTRRRRTLSRAHPRPLRGPVPSRPLPAHHAHARRRQPALRRRREDRAPTSIRRPPRFAKPIFSGDGCCISQASASMLVEQLEGKVDRRSEELSRPTTCSSSSARSSRRIARNAACLSWRVVQQAIYSPVGSSDANEGDASSEGKVCR